MEVSKDSSGFVVWFSRAGKHSQHSKCISVSWLRKPWIQNGNKPRICTHYNGAVKGVDSCYDRSWIIGYLIISYTNWNYSKGWV
jgi:hypothetical protein